MTFIDFQSIICRILSEHGIADGRIFVADEPLHLSGLPVVTVAMTTQSGNTNEGFWEAMVTVCCSDSDEYAALRLAHDVRGVLDGFGGYGIADIAHASTIPVRTYETAPVTHTYALTFRVLYQEF
ncbi:MAG TPA: hypothetical protein O0X27_04155 [Methanocorpusculum sp.]|nr:hypothetical protein [Methanocorpusculum sp.]